MLRTKWMVCVLAGLAASVALAVSQARADGPACPKCKMGGLGMFGDCPFGKLIEGHIGRLMVLKSELDVTKEQKTKIHDIVKSHKVDIAKAVKDIFEKKIALHNAILAEKPEEQAIRKAADEMGKSIGDASLLASKIAGEIKPVLTAEQREKIQKCRGGCEEATRKFLDKLITDK